MSSCFRRIVFVSILIYQMVCCAKDAVHVELGGLGLLGSLNYELNVIHTDNWDFNQSVGLCVALQIQTTTTALWFKGPHRLETSIGTKFSWIGQAPILPAVSLNLGYRYEKEIVFRIVPQIVYLLPWSDFPYAYSIVPWITVSIGWSFYNPLTKKTRTVGQ